MPDARVFCCARARRQKCETSTTRRLFITPPRRPTCGPARPPRSSACSWTRARSPSTRTTACRPRPSTSRPTRATYVGFFLPHLPPSASLIPIGAQVEGLTALLSLGASPLASDGRGATPLHNACYNGHAAVAQLLIERLPEDQRARYVNAQDASGKSQRFLLFSFIFLHDSCYDWFRCDGAAQGVLQGPPQRGEPPVQPRRRSQHP
jgi:hypothetical protein